MNAAQARLYKNLQRGSNSMELVNGGDVSRSGDVGVTINQIVGNPTFKAEISLNITVRYYSQAAVGTPAAVVPPAGQQNPLPLYLFGANDYESNYTRARALVTGAAGFNYGDMSIIAVGLGQVGYFPLPHAAASVQYVSGTIFNNIAANGDLLFLIPMTGFVAGAAATTVTAEILVHCPNVPYIGLVSALTSDLITLNMIRYVVPAAAVAQFAQQITLIRGSLFGRQATDTLDPQTFITPGTFQPQIADMPINVRIDKNFIAATQIAYTAVVPIQLTWTITVASIDKLSDI
jgi:hypothetical protein